MRPFQKLNIENDALVLGELVGDWKLFDQRYSCSVV